nr:DUF1194 domain-containing protein [Azospirillum sp. SYSU D00513]
MRAILGLVLGSLTLPALLIAPARAVADIPETDVNIVTALDVSDSIGRHEEFLQQHGTAVALTDPAFLAAATAGPRGRIGFAVVTWAGPGQQRVVIPWTIIAGQADAERVAARMRAVTLVDRTHDGGGDHETEAPPAGPERLTDVSDAIEASAALLAAAPFQSDRNVVNICTNGIDNVDAGPGTPRARALAQRITINGVAVGERPDVAAYLREHVIGGSGAFVLTLSGARHASDLMAYKFVHDIAALED